MRLGEFDPEDMNPYNKINTSVIQSEEHRELAIKAAMRSFVLLKNDKNILPLKSKVSNLAVSQFQYLTVFGRIRPLRKQQSNTSQWPIQKRGIPRNTKSTRPLRWPFFLDLFSRTRTYGSQFLPMSKILSFEMFCRSRSLIKRKF